MLNVLGISWDYYIRNLDSGTNGDFNVRQREYSERLKSLVRIVYSPQNTNTDRNSCENNLEIYYSSSKNRMYFPLDVVNITRNIIKDKHIDVLSAEDPVFAGPVGLFLRNKYKIPLNVQIHFDAIDNPYRLSQRKRNHLYNIIAKWVVRRADSIRVVSEEIKMKLLNIGIDEKKIWVVPVRITASMFENAVGDEIRKDLLKGKYNKLVLFVGRLSPEKDIPTLLKAFAKVLHKHSSALLLIVGEGRERAQLMNIVDELHMKENVLFQGAVQYDLLPQYFAACDLFVLPSLREARGNVVVEAALCKKPIITTSGTGAQEWVINNQSGFIIKQKDHDCLADKILYLLDNSDIARQFGEREYNFVKEKLRVLNDVDTLIRCWEETAKVKVS